MYCKIIEIIKYFYIYLYHTIIEKKIVKHRGHTTYLFLGKTSYILRYIVKYMYFVVQNI